MNDGLTFLLIVYSIISLIVGIGFSGFPRGDCESTLRDFIKEPTFFPFWKFIVLLITLPASLIAELFLLIAYVFTWKPKPKSKPRIR